MCLFLISVARSFPLNLLTSQNRKLVTSIQRAIQYRKPMVNIMLYLQISDNWSVVWSTDNIPAMDNATGSGHSTRRARGRRRLRQGSLALGSFLALHCRVAASAITDGFCELHNGLLIMKLIG